MASVHPSAIVDPQAQLAADAAVAPHCVISGAVTVGPGCRIGPHCLVQGPAALGPGNVLYAHCSIGGDSQDKKHRGGGKLRIGARNTFREFCTVNRATAGDAHTVIGDDNLLMAYSHVAHECVIGSGCILANAAQLGGHVLVADRVVISGGVLVHQFCRIGTLAIIGGGTGVRQDVVPYASFTISDRGATLGINKVGLERAGLAGAGAAVAKGYKLLFHSGLSLKAAVPQLRELAAEHGCLQALADFAAQDSAHGIARPRRAPAGSASG